MWVAGPVMLVGTVIALWPQRVPSTARIPSPGRVAAGPRPTAA
jgi:hypothetical protein